MKGQALPVYWPFAPQVCTTFATHLVVFGMHTPAQLPVFGSHRNWHALPSFHMPAVHVSGILPEHCVVFAWHMPAHVPWSQTNGHAVPSFAHTPRGPQICGWFVLHCRCPGTQVPVH